MSNTEKVIAVLLREYAPEDVQKFLAYHKARPEIFEHFKRFAISAYEAGIKMSAKAVIERLRWELAFERKGEFKLTNSATALYARSLAAVDPRFSRYWKFKRAKGITKLE